MSLFVIFLVGCKVIYFHHNLSSEMPKIRAESSEISLLMGEQKESKIEQVLNPQKGISGTHSFRLIHTYIASEVTSWRNQAIYSWSFYTSLRSESINILVVSEKLLV